LANLLELESDAIVSFAERINSARKLYGQDSAFVIGMLATFEWLAETTSGGNEALAELSQHIDSPKQGTMASPQLSHTDKAVDTEGQSVSTDALSENTWIKGVVKWFNNDKGYGFISTESKVDVFVHWRDISSWDRSLEQGDEVEFMVTRSEKGFQAINVMKAGADEDEAQEASIAGTELVENGEEGTAKSDPVEMEEEEVANSSVNSDELIPDVTVEESNEMKD